LRFAGVGAVATSVHVTVAIVAAQVVVDPSLANAVGFCAAIIVSYLGHFHMTFQLGTEAGARHEVHIVRFLVVSLLGLGISAALVEWLTVGLGIAFPVTMGAVAGAVATLNFTLSSFWAFKAPKAAAQPASNRSGIDGTIVAGLIAATFIVLMLGHPINHDTAWYLVATRTWLEGGALYTEVVEINPPLAFYLTAPAIFLADLTGLDETTAFYLVLGALVFAVTSWIWSILGDASSLTRLRRAGLTAGVGLALFVPALDEIGQREHIMTILVAPWMIGWFVHPMGGKDRAAILRTSVAAVGLCLKPHFFMIPIALTFAEMIRTRSLWPSISASNITLAAIGSAYVMFVVFVHPAYFQNVVPVALAVYEAYSFSTLQKVINLQPVIVLAFALMAVVAWNSGGRSIQIAVALVVGAIGSYVLQNKGFTYHALPVVTFAVIGASFMLADTAKSRLVKVLCICVLALTFHDTLRDGRYRNSATDILLPRVQDLLAQGAPNQSIIVLSTGLGIAFPLVLEAETGWASRYPALWFVPGALVGLETTDCAAEPEKCHRLRSILEQSMSNTVEDINTAEPTLIIVDPWHRHRHNMEIDHLGLLRQADGGAEALEPYHEVDGVGAVRILQRRAD
jgi:putative flippase GtrA